MPLGVVIAHKSPNINLPRPQSLMTVVARNDVIKMAAVRGYWIAMDWS
jgi:hypothetical protein